MRDTSGLAKHLREATGAGVKRMRRKRGPVTPPSATLIVPHDDDICVCGDFRRDHECGIGRCIHNKPQDLTHGYENCLAFRPAKV